MPRAGLTTERVVEQAELLTDEVGPDDLTLAALAARLGVRQPSLYKHIAGLPGLRRSIAIRAKAELGEVLAQSAVGRSRGDAVRAMAAAYRGWARQHPGRYRATVRAADPADVEDAAAGAAVAGVVLAVLSGYGLDGDEALDVTRALRSALHGFVSLEAAGGFGLPRSLDRSFDRLVEDMVVALEHTPR